MNNSIPNYRKLQTFATSILKQNNKDIGTTPILKSILNQTLQTQATEQLKADPYERTSKRKGHLSGRK